MGENGGARNEAVHIDAQDVGSDAMDQSQESAFQVVFEHESRKVPSLLRKWRTPDPSPTRDGGELPRCCAPTLRMVRRDSASEDPACSGDGDALHVTAELATDDQHSTFNCFTCTSSSTVSTTGESGGARGEVVHTDAKDVGSDALDESQEAAFQVVFEQESRKVPSLPRKWRTPDPSPTRDGGELPRCCAPTLRMVRRDSASEDLGCAGDGGTLHVTAELAQDDQRSTFNCCTRTSSPAVSTTGEKGGVRGEVVHTDAKDVGNDTLDESQESAFQVVFEQESRKVPSLLRKWRTPDPSPTRDGEELPRCCAPTLRMVPRDSASEDSTPAERGRTVSRLSDPVPTPCVRTPSLRPYEAPFPNVPEHPGPSTSRMPPVFPMPLPPGLDQEEIMKRISSSSQTMAAQPVFRVPFWPCPPCVDASAVSSSDANAPLAEEAKAISVGSRGHPTECADPCKYFSKGRGCKDGAACDRCHVCPWKRPVREHTGAPARDSRGRARGRASERR
eukprot:TRINITY_DN6411_c0_g4_i1.p1 TRINITY_DN6411_c0_g4~~TRINITY_DN6411_c0_g4_i1.p1  ORF type:complete len:577 (-),score=62.45 TRINITY_DN6411_c0_g4_i1:114-1628(-)